MTNEEKIRLLEETLDLEANTITEETALADIREFDSMAKLTLIVMFDDEFDIKLTGEKLKEFKTVKDVIDFMN